MNPQSDEPCDRQVAGPLVAARQKLRHLLIDEAGTLVSVLGHVEVALEQSIDPYQRGSVRQHCHQVLRLVRAIERRHGEVALAADVAACVNDIRSEVERALRQLDGEPPPGQL